MKINRKTLSILALALAAFMASTSVQAALPGTAPLGNFLCGRGIFRCFATLQSAIFPQTQFSTQGIATYNVVSNDRNTSNLQPVQWTGNGQNAVLGAVQWNFDVSRTVQNSTISSQNADGGFPATGDLYFYVNGTIGAFPGRTFQSQTPLHLSSLNLQSFYPFSATGEVFNLVGTVDFEDVNNPGQKVFTLSNLSLTLGN
ncbi:MAG: hypothetical protein JST22_05465 [Bacteroidetes bacterium]|nr:hypothetical protein [Bacteroidota bacterium]